MFGEIYFGVLVVRFFRWLILFGLWLRKMLEFKREF